MSPNNEIIIQPLNVEQFLFNTIIVFYYVVSSDIFIYTSLVKLSQCEFWKTSTHIYYNSEWTGIVVYRIRKE